MEIFTIEEKVFMVFQFAAGQSLEQVVNAFLERFDNRPIPSVQTVSRVVRNFRTYGCVSPLHHKPLPQNNNEREEQEIMICVSVEENPDQSIKEIAEQFDLPRETARKVLKKNGYCSYKVQKMNQIFPQDVERRLFL
ncbi:hypothetical protein ABEB36_014442 [Hypothenemus hampei]|uniref:DUF4817 domain-containing protein n=1 Tax=Hypothenemus hampei TaxID=57062 RepID=A0ABD1E216_HYPHA